MLEGQFLDELVRQARQGDDHSRQVLIERSKTFIEKVTLKICKRRVTWSDDEMSVSLIAFNEAIDRYKKSQHENFYSYAKVLIQSRLIDYFRQEGRQQVAISLDDVPRDTKGEEYELNPAEIQQAWEHYRQQQMVQERLEEIKVYATMLEEYGISLDELADASPARTDARANLVQIAHDFVKYPHLVEYLVKTRQLPLKQMLAFSRVSRKTLERGRKYIIALILILIADDLPHLKSLIAFPDLGRRVRP